jgi:16S rRNA A1518/A1519 N6-dimethyltransferase RsmA/KsgA/DIM1 with predicted DNA glycosylase/AP lyase activity
MISNLPYGVGNRILVNAALGESVPERITVMVQRDVAERMMAQPDGKEYGVLSLFLQLRYDVTLVRHVSPGCFVPEPRVWSSVVTLKRNPAHDAGLTDRASFQRVVRECFSCRRKQIQVILHKHLSGSLAMDAASGYWNRRRWIRRAARKILRCRNGFSWRTVSPGADRRSPAALPERRRHSRSSALFDGGAEVGLDGLLNRVAESGKPVEE